MRIAFVMIVFQSDHVLEPCLQAVLPYGRVYAAEGPVKYWQAQGFTTSTDGTNEILARYQIPTVHGQWTEKDEEARAALAQIPAETEFVWFVDADEVWDTLVLEKVVRLLETQNYDSISFKPHSFFGGFERCMGGFEERFEWHRIQRYTANAKLLTHRPPTIAAPDGRPWKEHRHLNHEATARAGLRFHHYSYVFPSQVKAKTRYYHSWTTTIKQYYETVYLPWVHGTPTERVRIEERYDGVHDWLPERRGDARTYAYKGKHPAVIEHVMPALRARMARELAGA